LAACVVGEEGVRIQEALSTIREGGALADGIIGAVEIAPETAELSVCEFESVWYRKLVLDWEVAAIWAFQNKTIAQICMLCCLEPFSLESAFPHI